MTRRQGSGEFPMHLDDGGASSMTSLHAAISFALTAHAGQKDKGGKPYVLHPLRVMARVPIDDEESQIAAVLHDVVEDCGYTVLDIGHLFGQSVAEIVDSLSRRNGERYVDFILRCKANPKARAIKILDIEDNMSPDRVSQLDPEERLSMAVRYAKALDILQAD